MADVHLREVEAIKVAVLRRRGPVREVNEAFRDLYGRLVASGAPLARGPGIGVFYGEAEAFDPENATYEVCVPLAGEFAGSGDVEVKHLPAARMACAVHKGAYDAIGPLYAAVFAWLGAKGLRPAGPCREVYVAAPGPGFLGPTPARVDRRVKALSAEEGRASLGPKERSPEEFVTEVQVPVAPASLAPRPRASTDP